MPSHRRQFKLVFSKLLTNAERNQSAEQAPQRALTCAGFLGKLARCFSAACQTISDAEPSGHIDDGGDALGGDQVMQRDSRWIRSQLKSHIATPS